MGACYESQIKPIGNTIENYVFILFSEYLWDEIGGEVFFKMVMQKGLRKTKWKSIEIQKQNTYLPSPRVFFLFKQKHTHTHTPPPDV